MLETLDSTEWAKINHAYGPASDLPESLRALAFGDDERREKALWELHGNIWHQGTVYEATAHAVPFLLEMLRGKHPESARILALLALIANGRSYVAVHGNLAGRQYEVQLARELEWVQAARNAVGKGIPLFMELAGSSDKKLRELSIFLLGRTASQGHEDISEIEVIEKLLGID